MPRTTRGCRVDFDENFCSDLLVKRCAGNVIDFHFFARDEPKECLRRRLDASSTMSTPQRHLMRTGTEFIREISVCCYNFHIF